MDADVWFSINSIAQVVAPLVWVVAAFISLFALIGFLRAIKNGAIALLEQENSVTQELNLPTGPAS